MANRGIDPPGEPSWENFLILASGRNFQVNGETLVKVKGGAHMSGKAIGKVTELGLTAKAVQVIPNYRHRDWSPDDFGGEVPADVMWMLSDVTVKMDLVHYDPYVLEVCLGESMGGGGIQTNRFGLGNIAQPWNIGAAGIMAPAARMLGKGLPMFASGNNYISLNLLSPQLALPYRFRHCYLSERPVVIPLGTEASVVQCTWRAVPYVPVWISGRSSLVDSELTYTAPAQGDDNLTLLGNDYVLRKEVVSSGTTLWDHQLDEDPVGFGLQA